jgi:hypothetical protein
MNPNPQDLTNSSSVKLLAAFIHGFSDHTSDKDEMIAAGSTVLNRIESGRKEFGDGVVAPTTIEEVLYSPKSKYYEVSGKNERFNEAMSGKVAKYNESSYKKALQIANALMTGNIDTVPGEFIYRPSEEERLVKSKGHDFSKTEKVGSLKRYNLHQYKRGK